ncbi:ABC transporter ATP-binding protein [Granulosicoccus sp. 3-233]|uniref:ABC transporter ATP-binding protein n=1 Tax=Granulosicoccus sp. 3-233 TaxID=3417969 RepID=UPI003D355D7B
MIDLDLQNMTVQRNGRCLVNDVSLLIPGGSLCGLTGPNGAGKSSLLRAVAQLLPHTGHCRLGAQWLEQSSADWRARSLAYLAQTGELAWPMAVRDFVSLGRLPHRRRGVLLRRQAVDDKSGSSQVRTDTEAVALALDQTGLTELATRPLNQLSGGELARVRLARALAVDADVLLADEPCASLDPHHQLKVMELLHAQSRRGRVVLVVLHDLTLASRFCDQLLLLHEGVEVASGEPRRVLTPDNLQSVYQLQAIHGEFRNQSYIVPWQSSHAAPHAHSMNQSGCGLQEEVSVR